MEQLAFDFSRSRSRKRPLLASYGKWMVVCEVDPKIEPTGTPQRRLLVRCACGLEVVRYMSSLASGATLSCRACAVPRTHRAPRDPSSVVFDYCPAWLFSRIRRGAADRDLAFELTRDELTALYREQGLRCALSGLDLVIRTRDDRKCYTTASLDRIDSALGYAAGNVQWVHKRINMMKGTLSQGDFRSWCDRVFEAGR